MPLTDKILQFDSGKIKNPDTSIVGLVTAKKQWLEILTAASDSELKTISYVDAYPGNILLKDNIKSNPPQSLPGKLLAFLFHRYKYFKGAPDKGVTIISTESFNAEALEAIVLELAHLNNLSPVFLDWIENSNRFI